MPTYMTTNSQSTQDSNQEISSWARTELESVDFGDERLNKRGGKLLDLFFTHPQSSIPEAMGNWPDTKAAYRFFDNEKVTPEKILQPHLAATQLRFRGHPIILAVQDTTTLNYTPHPATTGLGTIGSSSEARGMHVHTTMAFTVDRVPICKHKEESVDIHGVYLNELNPPEDVEPLSWMLLTTLLRVTDSKWCPRPGDEDEKKVEKNKDSA